MIRALGILAPLAAAPALAEPVTLDLAGPASRGRVAYRCSDGTEPTALYVNLAADSLAVLPVGGVPRLFVTVLSGSGARYASGSLVWWTRGGEATLTDETGTASPVTCQEKS